MSQKRPTNSAHLRRKFWSWSVALATTWTGGTISAVALPNSQVWAQETESNAGEKVEFDSKQFDSLIKSKKLAEATELLDAALKEKPADAALWRYNAILCSALGSQNPASALARAGSQAENLLSLDDLSNQQVIALRSMISLVSANSQDAAAALKLIEQAESKVRNSSSEKLISSLKIDVLVRHDQFAEAKSLLDSQFAAKLPPQEYFSTAIQYINALGSSYEADVAKVEAEAVARANALVEGDRVSADHAMTYANFMLFLVSKNTYDDPKKAMELINSLDAVLEKIDDTDNSSRQIQSLGQRVTQQRELISKSLKRLELIGQVAQDFGEFADHNHLIGMEEKSLQELRGKVVLLDFWAVWCGPCIATFPHLREWHEKYSEKGFRIVGSTKFYNWQWDEIAGKAVRSNSEVSPEDELAMLEKFRRSYDLPYGFVITDKEVNYGESFGVTGIPQAVLIDKSGRIQMIRVGASEKNARALHDKIEELLAQ